MTEMWIKKVEWWKDNNPPLPFRDVLVLSSVVPAMSPRTWKHISSVSLCLLFAVKNLRGWGSLARLSSSLNYPLRGVKRKNRRNECSNSRRVCQKKPVLSRLNTTKQNPLSHCCGKSISRWSLMWCLSRQQQTTLKGCLLIKIWSTLSWG